MLLQKAWFISELLSVDIFVILGFLLT